MTPAFVSSRRCVAGAERRDDRGLPSPASAIAADRDGCDPLPIRDDVGGRVKLDSELPEGTSVTVLARDGDETFEVDPETERLLLEAMAQCDRDETVQLSKLLGELRDNQVNGRSPRNRKSTHGNLDLAVAPGCGLLYSRHDQIDERLQPWPLRIHDDDDGHSPPGQPLLVPQILVRCHEDVEALGLSDRQQLTVAERRPALLARCSNGVAQQVSTERDGGALVEQDEHQRSVAARSRLRAANSITA